MIWRLLQHCKLGDVFMKIKMKKIFTLVSIMCLILLFNSCSTNVSENVDIEVSYENPEVKKDTNMGAEMPYIEFESEHKIIFSHSLGIFIYDLDDSKMLKAIKPSDSKIHIGTQGDISAGAGG